MVTEEELIKTIADAASATEPEILQKIEEKEIEYSGLVSRIGAIYIVGKELGVDLARPVNKSLKIKNIVSDMNAVEFIGKVVFVSEVQEFTNDKGNGRVASVLLGDETGTIRLTLWNEKADVVEKIKPGDVLEVLGAYTKKNYRGEPEVRLSKHGNLRKAEDCDITVIEKKTERSTGFKPTTLDKINENDYIRIKAHLNHIYERTMIHYLCPACKKKTTKSSCDVHGPVEPEKVLVVTGFVDDGYGAINAVFFRDSAEKILQKTTEEIEKEILEKGERGFFSSINSAGAQFLLRGVVKKSNVSDVLELSVREVKKLDIINEINELLGAISEKNTLES